MTTATLPSQQARTWGDLLSPTTCLRLAVVSGLLLAAYWNVLRVSLVSRWMNEADWSHGWLIPLFSIYFLTTRREQLLRVVTKPNYLGAVVVALSLALYFVSAWRLRMAYPQAVSIVGAILGLTLLLGGWSLLKVVWFPIVFLLFAIPFPQRIFVAMTMPLREFASTVAAVVMPMFATGLHTEAQAVVIDYAMPGYGTGQLNVEEACSGMRSLMAFVTLGVAVTYVHERPTWQRSIMVLSCVPIAVFCNSIRVTITGLLYVYNQRDLAQGTPHALLGVGMFVVALGMYSLVGYVLNHLYVDDVEETATEPTEY